MKAGRITDDNEVCSIFPLNSLVFCDHINVFALEFGGVLDGQILDTIGQSARRFQGLFRLRLIQRRRCRTTMSARLLDVSSLIPTF